MPHGRTVQEKSEKTFTVDGKFLRDEAWEAIRSYFMPFAGLYAAFVGKEVRVVDRDSFNSGNRKQHSQRSTGRKSGSR